MTREERQKLGFDFNAQLPLPGFLQGGIPGAIGGGSAGTVTKLSNVTSFGVFSDYPQFLSQVPAPQFAGLIQGLSGTDWKGDKLVDSQGRPANAQQRVKVAIATTLDSFIPFLNVARQVIKHHGPSGFNPLRAYPPSTTNYLRSLSQKQQITVPISKSKGSAPTSSGSGGVDYGKVFSGGSGSGVDYGKVFSGG